MAIVVPVASAMTNESPWGILTGVRPAKIVHRRLDQGESPTDIQQFIQTRYGVSKAKAALLTEVALRNRSLIPTPENAGQESRSVSCTWASRIVYPVAFTAPFPRRFCRRTRSRLFA